jgi:hypothetical protein
MQQRNNKLKDKIRKFIRKRERAYRTENLKERETKQMVIMAENISNVTQ